MGRFHIAILSLVILYSCSRVQDKPAISISRNYSSQLDTSAIVLKKTLIARSGKVNRMDELAQIKKTENNGIIISPIQNFYNSVAKKGECFSVQPDRDTIIYCKEGTSIFIPAFAFRNSDGDIIASRIQFSVVEYISREDIVLNRLATMSGDMLLETGGMLYLGASCQGGDLQLVPGKALQIEVPTYHEIKSDMQIFTGVQQEENINWVLGDNSQKIKTTVIKTQNSSESNYQVLSCRITDNSEERYNWKERIYGLKDSLQTDTIVYNLKIDKKGRLKNIKFVSGTKQFKRSTLWDSGKKYGEIKEPRSDYSIRITAFERLNGFRVMPGKKRIPKVCIHAYTSMVNSIVLSDHLKRKDRKNATVLRVEEIITGTTNVLPGLSPNSVVANDEIRKRGIKLEEMENSGFENSDVHEIGFYALSVMKLGYINIDRFYTDPRPKVVLSLPAEHSNTNYQLIFKKDQVYLRPSRSGSKLHFRNIPEGEQVVLVATRIENSHLQLSTMIITLGASSDVSELKFRNVNISEMKDELQKSLE